MQSQVPQFVLLLPVLRLGPTVVVGAVSLFNVRVLMLTVILLWWLSFLGRARIMLHQIADLKTKAQRNGIEAWYPLEGRSPRDHITQGEIRLRLG